MKKVMVGKDGKPLMAARCAHFDANRPGVNEHGDLIGKHGNTRKAARQVNVENNAIVAVVNNIADEFVQGANVAIPLAGVEEVSQRFENTLYGYFIGKRLVFPLVETYVKNAWAKFGLERTMLTNGFFFFQFATREGLKTTLQTTNDKATTSNSDSSVRKDNQPTMKPEEAAKDYLEDVLGDDDEEVEEVYIEYNGRHAKQNKGASTPSNQVQDV
ncbi:hypothetical protein Tco_0678680 [Tanacetum coccineum]|uniref:DUF4283 domain-containing protein n=1 Tax=Tanacetum coccineum TaxID=301880 RepID=A0ABQ4XFY0_9ASTR